jgi:hypothetical protein
MSAPRNGPRNFSRKLRAPHLGLNAISSYAGRARLKLFPICKSGFHPLAYDRPDRRAQHPSTMISITDLQVGQRVARDDVGDIGTIVEADGEIKVKWDSGRTSYHRRKSRAKIQLVEE